MALLERRRPITMRQLFLTPSSDTPISEDGLRVSEKTYWEKYYHHPDFNYEWVNGRLEVKPVSNLATSNMYGWLVKLLEIFFETYKIAKLTRLETGFVVPLSPEKEKERRKKGKKGKNIRKPDLGVVLNSNPVPYNSEDNSYGGIADLCIEAISYTNKQAEERDTVEKKEEYEHAGVKEYYILDDRKKETAFLRLSRWGIYEDIEPQDLDIIRSEVLPGFQFRISDLYRQPDLQELVKDEVYQGFVMVKYQAEKKRAEAEKKKAEAEKERADRLMQQLILEQQEKERLMAILSRNGISVD